MGEPRKFARVRDVRLRFCHVAHLRAQAGESVPALEIRHLPWISGLLGQRSLLSGAETLSNLHCLRICGMLGRCAVEGARQVPRHAPDAVLQFRGHEIPDGKDLRSMKKICLGFLAEAVILSTIIFAWLAVFGNTPETYPDVIIEWTAMTGVNKSMEMRLMWLLVALTVLLSGGLAYAFRKTDVSVELSHLLFRKENYIATAFLAYAAVLAIVYSKAVILFCGAAVVAVIAAAWKKDHVLEAVIGFLFTYYALFGLVSFAGWAVPHKISVGANALAILSLLMALWRMKFRPQGWKNYISRVQILVPLGFFACMGHLFAYQGRIYDIPNPWQAAGFILAAAAAGVFFGWRKYRALAHDAERSLDDVISIWSCIPIYVMNQYARNGLVHVQDEHHPIENIIGFSQIFEHGQIPFAEYTPVSGFYSVVHGFFLYLFGNDMLANYGIASDVLLICLGALTLFLLHRLIPIRCVLFFAVFFNVIAEYDRVWLILPMILLLLQPEILHRPARMIVAWLLSSLVSGLYYPLYGAAVCLGFVPVVLYHAWTWRKGACAFTWKAMLPWGVAVLLILMAVPLLYGMAVHMLAMSSQTVWADGIGSFGQDLPGWFLKILPSWTLRIAAWQLVRFLLPMIPAAVGVWLLCRMFQQYRLTREFRLSDVALATLFLTVPIVSFSYTFVRLDFGSTFARSTFVLFPVVGLGFLYAMRHADASARKLCIVMVAVCVALLGRTPDRTTGSIRNFASVPDDFIYVDHAFPHSGEGFLSPVYYKDMQAYARYAQSDTPMFALPQFAQWYVLGIPGASTLESMTIRSYPATEEAIRILKAQKPVIGMHIDPYYNYYLFHWLLISGDYQYSAEDQVFYPQENPDRSMNRKAFRFGDKEVRYLAQAPSATGLSMTSLRKNFSGVSMDYDLMPEDGKNDIALAEPMDGDQADFLYVELEIENPAVQYGLITDGGGPFRVLDASNEISKQLMFRRNNLGKILKVSWLDDDGQEHAFQMDFAQGKLLIPLGVGPGWLLNSHDRIRLECLEDKKTIPIKAVDRVEFLKIRTVK